MEFAGEREFPEQASRVDIILAGFVNYTDETVFLGIRIFDNRI